MKEELVTSAVFRLTNLSILHWWCRGNSFQMSIVVIDIVVAIVFIVAVIHIAGCVTVNTVCAVVYILIAVINICCHIVSCCSQFCVAAIMLLAIVISTSISIVFKIIANY